jgi:hypothetical protein
MLAWPPVILSKLVVRVFPMKVNHWSKPVIAIRHWFGFAGPLRENCLQNQSSKFSINMLLTLWMTSFRSFVCGTLYSTELYIYLEREVELKKWSELRVNRAEKNNRKGLELTSRSSFNFRHLGKECAEISYFDMDLKNNTMVLWTENFVSDILYTLDSASNYPAIQKLKPWLQTQDISMKWEDSYVFYFLNRELKH